MTYDSAPDTYEHIERVRTHLAKFCSELSERARVHDASKLQEPEKPIYDRITPGLRGVEYGTAEYYEQISLLGEALSHHYAANSHHPEHFKTGVSGMTLLDVVEMLCDWKAASERRTGGSFEQGLEVSSHRFKISEELFAILRNTSEAFGWI